MSRFGSLYHQNRAAGKIPASPKASAKMMANCHPAQSKALVRKKKRKKRRQEHTS